MTRLVRLWRNRVDLRGEPLMHLSRRMSPGLMMRLPGNGSLYVGSPRAWLRDLRRRFNDILDSLIEAGL